jgi:hypothetical protein
MNYKEGMKEWELKLKNVIEIGRGSGTAASLKM